jgi:hypothetical protein
MKNLKVEVVPSMSAIVKSVILMYLFLRNYSSNGYKILRVHRYTFVTTLTFSEADKSRNVFFIMFSWNQYLSTYFTDKKVLCLLISDLKKMLVASQILSKHNVEVSW